MKRFVFKRLQGSDEIRQFVDGYVESCRDKPLQIRFAPDLDTYLRYDFVHGIYQNGALVGGFVINHYPHRCFSDMPIADQQRLIDKLGKDSVLELVSIWKARSVPRAEFTFYAWPRIVLTMLKHERSNLFGCALDGHGMKKRYLGFGMTVVKQGRNSKSSPCFTAAAGKHAWRLAGAWSSPYRSS